MPAKVRLDQTVDTRTISRRAEQLIEVVRQGFNLHTLQWAPFNDKHAELGGAPGAPLAPAALPEPVGTGLRVRYQHGTMYQRRDGGIAYVYGAIGQRYDELGGATSWLGLPLTDEADLPEGGRITVFERGAVYWWPDVGAIDLNDVALHYSGLICFGETDSDGDETPFEDEPYVILGLAAPTGTVDVRSQVYTDVDHGDTRPDSLELYRGRPSGLVIGVQLMEHDFGDPDKFKARVAQFVKVASEGIEKGLEYIPLVGPVLSYGAEAIMPYLEEPIADFLNTALDTDDDDLGRDVVTLSVKQMVVLAARTTNTHHYGVEFKVETRLLGSGQGASYKVCFSLGGV
ncbi:hypothetical protein V5H98_14985 [Georgenia sp. M64]|uniref:LGFP repeat-containing protein n=1 Tax=Georgenia sp. M64 TaxID=3120520 RepID=UPI0030DE2828